MSWHFPAETEWLPVEEASAAAGARRRATVLAGRLGFDPTRIGEIQLAATEAATNLHRHARGGEMVIRIVRAGERASLEIVCLDHGPGIADVSRSLLDGHSTGGTLGIGLGTMFRLADTADLHSTPSGGTVLAMRFGVETTVAPRVAGLSRAISGEDICGDAYVFGLADGGEGVIEAMLCDGLGHGPLAAVAAQEAVREFRAAIRPSAPAELLHRIHGRLSGTRGGAVSIVSIAGDKVAYAGLGNVSGWIVGADGRQGMVSVPGIAGHQARTVREFHYSLPPDGVVVMHSDGLTDRWRPTDLPGLFGRDPLLVAGALMSVAGTRHDDRSVIVIGRDTR